MRAILFLILLALALPLHATEIEKLRHYEPRGKYIYYTDRTLSMQAARFDLAAPGILHTITVTLGGGKGTARVRLFGDEGGLNAPLLERDLVDPIMLTKTRAGVERVTITLPDPVHINTAQLFIAVDNLSPNVRLLSDQRSKKPACRRGDETYFYQLIKYGDAWQWGKYGYAIELGFEFDRSKATTTFSDVTAEVELPDMRLANGAIAWADINADGYLDLLAGGRLFRNDGGREFRDITTSAGITSTPVIQAFLDVNNDARPDIITIGDSSALYLNSGGIFTRREIEFPGVHRPTCFSIADIDRDGRLDLFIGGEADSLKGASANNLYLNEGNGRFRRDTVMLRQRIHARATIASQWVDYDNNGTLDLYTVDADGVGTIWRNLDGKELLPTPADNHDRAGSLEGRSSGVRSIGCGWADYNNDGAMDLLTPGPAISRHAAVEFASLAQVKVNSGAPDFELADTRGLLTSDYLEERAGGAAADVDNDGLLDAVLTTSCRCSFVSLFKQTSMGTLEEKTSQSGLWRVAGGPDAVWADYNNDGAIDLAMMRDGRIVLYRNTSAATNNYIDIDLDDPAGNRSGVGARVTVYCGDNHYTREVASGRGLAMQDPLRLHFGIGAANAVDSVTVRWPNSSYAESFTDLAINHHHVLKSGRASSSVAEATIELHATPNPFTDRLVFTYSIPRPMHVRLDLYSSNGELIATLVDEDKSGGDHTLGWEAKDASGKRLPQGTYVYRLMTPIGEKVGKAVLKL